MKKIIFFIATIIIIVTMVSITYTNYKGMYREAESLNKEFEYYYNKEITGTDLTTIINKAINLNEKNGVEKNSNKEYIENDKNSIKIEIKFIDAKDDVVFKMESLYNGGMNKFVQYYGSIKFKCTQITYHEKTKKIKTMYFEQITQ